MGKPPIDPLERGRQLTPTQQMALDPRVVGGAARTGILDDLNLPGWKGRARYEGFDESLIRDLTESVLAKLIKK